ncbi:hypothetical protein Mapa_017786 [Marchantia paleacea]|nr:hypothetical protein Mapa_017786 [Marchantia paleacea]
MEDGVLILRRGSGTIHFRGSCLVVPDFPARGLDVGSHGLEQTQSSGGHDVRCVVRVLEGDPDVRLGSEIVHFIGADAVDPLSQSGGICEIAVVQLHARARVVRIDVDVLEALRVEIRRTTDDSVHFVSLAEQKFCQV